MYRVPIEGRNYYCRSLIGFGGNAKVYRIFDADAKCDFAFKMQSANQAAVSEIEILKQFQKSRHCPTLYDDVKFVDEDQNLVSGVVLQLLDADLYDLQRLNSCKYFTLGTCVRLTLQGLAAVEDLHNAGYIHRDIKPSNFMMGKGNSIVYLIDFGSAKCFNHYNDNLLQSDEKTTGLEGTVRYASPYAHVHGQQLSRRDDLWSLFFSFYEMALGSLPWEANDKNERLAGVMKFQCTPKTLCERLPGQMLGFVDHISKLSFNETPNYKYLARCLRDILKENNLPSDGPYDWQLAQSEPMNWLMKH